MKKEKFKIGTKNILKLKKNGYQLVKLVRKEKKLNIDKIIKEV